MSYLRYAFNSSLSRFHREIFKVAEREHRNKYVMFADFLGFVFIHGGGLTEYINYKIYDVPLSERKNYVTLRDANRFYDMVSPEKYKKIVTVKPNFMKEYRKYVPRDYCTYEDGFDKLCGFLDNHESFMYKPIDGLGGHEVRKMFSSEIADRQEFYKKLHDERAFVDELVIQHEDLNRLAPGSVNTLRAMTYANNGESIIFYTALRIGDGVRDVDNFHQGGMGVLVDPQTGKLKGNAKNKLNEVIEQHPYTHIKFDGYQLPNWEYVKNMLLEAALVHQELHVIGWDVAFTPNGATFIEANRRPGWDLIQSLDNGGSKFRLKAVLERYYADEKKKKE